MTDHADTIRRHLTEDWHGHIPRGEAVAALDALLAELRQAQEERDKALQQRDHFKDQCRGIMADAREVIAERNALRVQRREAIDALRKAHEWLERVEKNPGYMGLDHAVGENIEGCTFCARVALVNLGERP